MHLFDKVCSERYMDDVFNTADDRLSALFVAHDKDGDGNLDFEEYFGMVKKIRNEQKDSLSHRQLVRLYGDMALSPFVDAPTFVRIARAIRLAAMPHTHKVLRSVRCIRLEPVEVHIYR